ncbi:MAG: hypothetical protein R6X34_27020 [Chloroflexota bacterium]
MKRPFGVTILVIAAAVAAVLNAFITLRFLGLFPFLGVLDIRIFNLWYALMYGLMTYIWVWVAKMLWDLEEAGWLFVSVITLFNLIMNFVILVTGGDWYDVNVSVILNALILIYAMLPGTKRAFNRP